MIPSAGHVAEPPEAGQAATGPAKAESDAPQAGTRRGGAGALLSLVVPVYNERDGLAQFMDCTRRSVDALPEAVEYVFVDDGSTDGSHLELARIQRLHPRVRVVTLSRNWGKEAALTAGLAHARGDAVIPIDCDLQDPPEVIAALVRAWRDGFEVVEAVRSTRAHDPWLKRFSARSFYRVLDRIGFARMTEDAGDFRLLDRVAVDALLRYRERNRFMKGLMANVGFARTQVYYDRPARAQGESKWNYWKLWNLALDAITGFSTVPLRIWTYIGLAVAAWAALYGAWVVAKQMIFHSGPAGYTTLLTVMLLLGGLQMVGLGVIGEYIGRVVTEVKARPLYVVAGVRDYEGAAETAETAGAPRCPHCGGALDAACCAGCGAPLAPTAAFCSACGRARAAAPA